ncbi:MAG: hypothetical protein ONB48_15090 [candidate division KSB1 bacterium]|nr:hypothetical protein [candidate division KSB1 bacterium]MDZ7273437.1 hypothetical protein [candidate division KSB1 bacterium]MDZ7286971.1 hypothetical protein [candidate division KSB1 bacterium]MDZ7299676.1 hypothetical protein [candidate division KSB1 bacterium]MDZ7307940.1 hypothetical protein [candidate division KSB1 bacterium]
MKHGKEGRFTSGMVWLMSGLLVAGTSLSPGYGQQPATAKKNRPAPAACSLATASCPPEARIPSLAQASREQLLARLRQAQRELAALRAQRDHLLKALQHLEQRMLTRSQRSSRRPLFSEKRIRPSA